MLVGPGVPQNLPRRLSGYKGLRTISTSMKHTVAHINMYDDPDSERAKMKIAKWFSTTEKGQWCRERFSRMAYNIEPDGGMEPHYWIELELEFSDHDSTLYSIRWGSDEQIYHETA